MTEKAVRQLRTNFEKLGARLGENLAGQFCISLLQIVWRIEIRPGRAPRLAREALIIST